MKILKNVFSVLTVVFAVAALVMFFLPFGKIVLSDGNTITRVGAEFAFGSDYNGGAAAKSSQILFCMILTAFTVLFAALSFKFKGTRWATVGFSAVDAVYMLVVACRKPVYFLDVRGIISGNIEDKISYVNHMPLLISIALFLTLICGIVYLLSADKLAVEASGENKLTIPQRVVKFLRDYKGELKKIVWPNFRTVLKNTGIVLIMCVLVGVFIWAVDLGLGALLDLIYNR